MDAILFVNGSYLNFCLPHFILRISPLQYTLGRAFETVLVQRSGQSHPEPFDAKESGTGTTEKESIGG
jgi:hypothetical protein